MKTHFATHSLSQHSFLFVRKTICYYTGNCVAIPHTRK